LVIGGILITELASEIPQLLQTRSRIVDRTSVDFVGGSAKDSKPDVLLSKLDEFVKQDTSLSAPVTGFSRHPFFNTAHVYVDSYSYIYLSFSLSHFL
jgi:hypothetical protein